MPLTKPRGRDPLSVDATISPDAKVHDGDIDVVWNAAGTEIVHVDKTIDGTTWRRVFTYTNGVVTRIVKWAKQ